MASVMARLGALTLRAAPAKAGVSNPVQLSARRSCSLGGCAALRRPAAAPKAASSAPATIVAGNGKATTKLKTRKSAAKRYKVTASGKVVRRHAMKGHLLAKKSPARKRKLGQEALVERSDLNNVRDCLPYAGVR